MSDVQTKKKKQSPESAFLDTLKGKEVGIVFVNDNNAPRSQTFLRCKLLWVDRYTYGVEHTTGPGKGEQQELIHKHAVSRMFLVEGTGYERG